jgi:hypothetical protein
LGAASSLAYLPLTLSHQGTSLSVSGLLDTGATANVAEFPPVRLAFAWTQARDVPLILGQANFFLEFDVCFFRSRMMFEIAPKESYRSGA